MDNVADSSWLFVLESAAELAPAMLENAACDSLIELDTTLMENVDDSNWLSELESTTIELEGWDSLADRDADADADAEISTEPLCFTLLALELLRRTLVFRLELTFLEDDTAPSHFPNALLQPDPQYALELPHPEIRLAYHTRLSLIKL